MNRMLGLHPVDWLVILLYFLAMIAIGLWARRRVRDTRDFYQGGRSFGRILMAFLNFGNMTDAGQVASVTSEVYRQGLQGVWFQNLVLFHTPFQWFIAALQRRARYIGPGDMYLHRFESRFLAGLYAAVLVAIAIYANSFGYLLTGKTLQAVMVKPPTAYTAAERESVSSFRELQRLKKLDFATLDSAQRSTLNALQEREKRGELKAFVSELDLKLFYVIYALLIAGYTVLGGLFAIAIIDVVQGLLILFLSLALLPTALAAIGGLDGLRGKVAPGLFQLFGTSADSDYTWYFVASFALLNLVVNAPKNFTLGGSPKDDLAARVGFVSGAVAKRFLMIGWAFTGLLALGLYSNQVTDATNVWGFMTRDLLGVGAIGLMIAAIFSANMDGNATISLDASAAVIKNIVQPIFPSLQERRQVLIGRVIVLVILLGSIYFADRLDSLLVVFKYILSVGTVVGPSFWLVYFWRRLNTRAVATQMIISIFITIILPNVVPKVEKWNRDPSLTAQTEERVVTSQRRASEEDVRSGLAPAVGAAVTRRDRIAPAPIFFESVKRNDSLGVMEGSGLFRPQIWLLSRFGVDFRSWSRPAISTASFLFDATVPFLLLIGLSLVTRRNSEEVLRDFYARVHTPAVADPALDARLVREKIDDPTLVERNKIFPGTDWEFWRLTRIDVIGLVACILFVFLVIGLYMLLARLLAG